MTTKRVWAFHAADARDALSNCRVFVQALEHDAGAPFDSFAACLVYSELVSNVVTHAPGPIDIQVDREERRLMMTVADCGRGFSLRPNLPDDPLADSGRGLFLVAQFAKDLSAGTDEQGRHFVRVTLPPTGS